MKSLRNKVQLIGHMGNDPEIKHLSNGRMVASLSLATSESYKNSLGKKVVETQWHKCVAWGKVAELLEKYTHKGKEIAVEGKLVSRSYEDKEGVKRSLTEVVISDVLLINPKTESNINVNNN